jgi:CRP/FNR family transcriptional regulator
MVDGNRWAEFSSRSAESAGNTEGPGGWPGWAACLSASRRRIYSPKQILFREGEAADTVFALRRGLVKLVAYSPDGRMRIVRLHGTGALLGLGGLLNPTHEYTGVAVDKVEADCLSLAAVARLRKDDPELYCRLLETWYVYLRSADFWITDFSTGSIRARVARLVNFLATLQRDGSSGRVELLTCEEMAGVLGVTVESVSRTLAEFKRRKLLKAVRPNPTKLYERDARGLLLAARE